MQKRFEKTALSADEANDKKLSFYLHSSMETNTHLHPYLESPV